MRVNEVIKLAQDSELNQLAIKDDLSVIRGYINTGILEIHKRFSLLQQEAVITLVDGVNTYKLDDIDVNVVMNLNGNQLMLVEAIYDNEMCQMSLNNKKNLYTVLTPSYNTLKVPDVVIVPGETITVSYRAAPSFIAENDKLIPLPLQFLQPLLNYIGYRGHSSVSGDEKSENNTHFRRFEKSCNDIRTNSLFIDTDLESTKFSDRGFV